MEIRKLERKIERILMRNKKVSNGGIYLPPQYSAGRTTVGTGTSWWKEWLSVTNKQKKPQRQRIKSTEEESEKYLHWLLTNKRPWAQCPEPKLKSLGRVVCTSNPSAWEEEKGGSLVLASQSHLIRHPQGSERPCPKTNKVGSTWGRVTQRCPWGPTYTCK